MISSRKKSKVYHIQFLVNRATGIKDEVVYFVPDFLRLLSFSLPNLQHHLDHLTQLLEHKKRKKKGLNLEQVREM